MKDLLNIFRNRLLDLSAANRSVFLPKVYKGKFSDLKTWDYLSAHSSLDIIRSIWAGKSVVKIGDVRHIKTSELDLVLEEAKKLIRTRQLIFDETGSADFYVGWPFVEGVLKNGMPLRAPLIFFPYQLKQVGREVFLEKETLHEPFWNRSLFLSLAYFEEYHFENSWLENTITVAEESKDQDFRLQVLDQLKKQGWSPSFDRDFLSDTLNYCLPVSKSDLETVYPAGTYKLKPYAVMGLFPQSASYIHSDYESLFQKSETNTIESLFSNQFNQRIEESKALEFIPLMVDGSQETIISKISSGESLVVQGPPGSGKTQLICNLIAQFIGKGKKVLVVCQKKAALDVIYERLLSIDLGNFVSLLHDAGQEKKRLFDKISEQINSSELYKNQNIHPDTIVLEKEFSRVQSSIARLTDFFSKYKQALYDTQIGGETAHALYLLSDKKKNTVNLELEFQSIPAHEVESKSYDLEQFLFYHGAIEEDFELIHAAVNSNLSIDDKEEMLHLIEKIDSLKETIELWNAEEDLMKAINFSFARSWLQTVRSWINESLIYQHAITYEYIQQFPQQLLLEWKSIVSDNFSVLNRLKEPPAHRYIEKWNPLIKKSKRNAWNRFYVKSKLAFADSAFKQWIKSNKFDHEDELSFLAQVFDSLDELELLKQKWSVHDFLQTDYGIKERFFNDHLHTFDRIYHDAQKIEEITALSTIWKSPSFKERLDLLVEKIDKRSALLSSYFKHWKPLTVDQLFEQDQYKEKWLLFVRQRFEQWLGYEQLKRNLDLSLFTSFHKVIRESDSVDKHQIIDTWKQSVYRSWIEEKEKVYPILKTVSTPEWEMKEKELQVLIDRRYSLSLEYLKIKLREWVYSGIQYNRLNRQVTYRELSHQVTKKRNVWPVRKLIAQHEEEILNLMPCWLVSPETASTIFPMHDLFDLVIFDEASQCFVEKAFPSLFRAKQAVVIGDDKQLRPSDLYRVRYKNEDEEEDADYDVESLLDFASRYFPSHMLTGHYRSKSEDLIRFSNEYFYEGRLRIVPDLAYLKNESLQFIKVDGTWSNNINLQEANKIVELVQELMYTHQGKSIGIITFNYPQAFLIRDTLDAADFVLPRDLMIKNIENVQGDERDIIIFSIAYATNKEGKVVAQFGSLSQQGGENRLNVAISRAREKVIIVSSIYPDQLKVEHHKNKGPELLKQYMHMVYETTLKKNKINLIQPSIQFERRGTLRDIIKDNFVTKYTAAYFADLQECERPEQLVFSDDQRYFYSPSVNDWHAYSVKLFEQKGWRTNRVYARNYWFDRERFFTGL